MTNKCDIDGSAITPCDLLIQAQAEGLGHIDVSIKRHIATNRLRAAVVIGKTKASKVEINYCPFCGGCIQTSFQDPKHDTP